MLLAFYFLLLVFFTFGPDLWIWHHFTEDSNLLIASVWFLPSLIIIASWFAVRKGFHHVAAVRLIFGGMLCFTFPKIAFILTYWFLGTQIAFYLALGIVACVLYGLIWGWRRVVVKNITIYSPDLPASFDGYRILQLSDFHVPIRQTPISSARSLIFAIHYTVISESLRAILSITVQRKSIPI